MIILPSLIASKRLNWLLLSNSFKNIQMYRKTFFFGPGKIRIISQHLSNDSAYRHSSSNGLANGSGGDSNNISNASAAVWGVPAKEFKSRKKNSN